uniref:RNA-directed DNA polymerase n=1 Tax=Colletotrichum gloeosporioides TaxID=474922 RepID=Q9HFY7_COLGL|nr:pol protein [Colletotrichum gloeosporioides]
MKWEECQNDKCLIHATQKAKALRLLQQGSNPPRLRFQENRLTKARREGKQITYPGQPEQSKNLDSPTEDGPRQARKTRSICLATLDQKLHLQLRVIINNQTAIALIDSGSEGDFVSPRAVNKLRIPWHEKRQPYQLNNVEGEQVQYEGGTIKNETAPLEMSYLDRNEQLQLDITNIGEYDLVLGMPWLEKNNPRIDWRTGQLHWDNDNLVPEQPCKDQASNRVTKQGTVKRYICYLKAKEATSQTLKTTDLNRKDDPLLSIPEEYRVYERLFAAELETGLPEHTSFDHEIPLKEGKEPRFNKIYGLNPTEMKALDKYLEENLKKGYIRESTSPAGSPILFVPKKNGKLRLCVDYRMLNEMTIKNRYPLPLIDELQRLLHGANWFTALDLKGAYNLIRMKEGEEWKTAFRTRKGHFEYLVMPFGLTNAPATFQNMINQVLRKFVDIFVVVYLDDILIFSPTLKQHKEHVHLVLQALQNAKLLVEPEKSKFHAQEVEYLGFTITPGHIHMSKDKVRSIQEWPTPTNLKEVQSFLGLVNFYRKFIKYYGKINTPLTDLSRKDQPFEWKEAQEIAFKKIKDRITSEPVLMIPNPQNQFEVEADASDFALGAQLSQRDSEGRLHPCAFFSRKLHGPELNYQIHDKELMAIIEAFKEWRPELSGTIHEVLVYTDHKNLAHFTTSKVLNKRQIRWSEFLSEFNFRIIYRKGSENGRADALSRRPDYNVPVPEETQVILKHNDNGDLVPATKLLMMTGRSTASPPSELDDEAIMKFHSLPAHGHQGVTKTWKRLRQQYGERVTRERVAIAIKDCEVCLKSKPARHQPYGLLQPLPVPQTAWHSISLDFIVKLPKSREPLTGVHFDSVLVIVDRLTKYAYFIPYKESSNAEEFAYTFLKYIIANHGTPKEIVSDRDKIFTSNFWKSITAQLGIKQAMSTAFHPQTDGQTERTNQILETYLRAYVNYDQDNWVVLLPIAQFAYNSAVGESTKESPFYLNYGFEPTAYGEPRAGPEAVKAVASVKQIKDIQANARRELEFVRKRMTHFSNQRRIEGPTLREGDSAYLIRRNIKTKRPSDKLDYKKLGPFKILKQISPVNFKLDLPETMKCHPVFHISLLEPAPRGSRTKDIIIVEDNEREYEVERIIDHSDAFGEELHFLVKWLGYGHEDNTWEPQSNLTGAKEELEEYWKQYWEREEKHRYSMPQCTRSPTHSTKQYPRIRHPHRHVRPPTEVDRPRQGKPSIRLGTPERN